MSKKPNKKQRIIKYIQDFGSITSKEAFNDLGITSFTARMSELRKEGYVFKVVTEKGKNRYGEPVIYKRYSLDER